MKTVLIVFCTVFMLGLIPSDAAIYDDFNDNSLDLSKWEVETDAETAITEVGGRIELSILPAASGDEFGASVKSTLMFTGDFDIQVDFLLVSWPADNGVRSSLEVGSDSGSVFIERSASSPLGYRPERYLMGGDGLLSVIVSTSDDSGMLRIQRLGDVITGYYFDTNAGWQVISTYSSDEVGFDPSESLSLSLIIWSHDSPPFFNPGGQPVIVAFDNVQIATAVPPQFVVDFLANPTMGPAPLTVNFADQSTGNITSWEWDFGDGSKSTTQNPSHTYTDPGTYTVTLTVTGPEGSGTEVKANYIEVKPLTKAMPWIPLLLLDD